MIYCQWHAPRCTYHIKAVMHCTARVSFLYLVRLLTDIKALDRNEIWNTQAQIKHVHDGMHISSIQIFEYTQNQTTNLTISSTNNSTKGDCACPWFAFHESNAPELLNSSLSIPTRNANQRYLRTGTVIKTFAFPRVLSTFNFTSLKYLPLSLSWKWSESEEEGNVFREPDSLTTAQNDL